VAPGPPGCLSTPLRHYLDSEHHLIDNGIITSARDTFVRKGRPFVCGLDGFTIDTAWGRAVDGAYRAARGMNNFVDQASSALKDLF
jgi:hypothetical protein